MYIYSSRFFKNVDYLICEIYINYDSGCFSAQAVPAWAGAETDNFKFGLRQFLKFKYLAQASFM